MSEKAKILVAEDVDGNYFLLECILGDQYELYHAMDGQEAVNMFETVNPDIILMDIQMPNMDGVEATKLIRKINTTTPILAVTAYNYDKDNYLVDEAKENGFTGIILKPIRSDTLIQQIEDHLKK